MKNNGSELLPSRRNSKKSIVSLSKQGNDRFPFLHFETDSDKSYITQMIMEGDSMKPTIEINALLVVDTRVKTYVDDGIYVVSCGIILAIRRIVMSPSRNKFAVSSDNPLIRSVEFVESHELHIVGKVIYSLTGKKIF